MNNYTFDRAQVYIEALPYIQQHHNKVVVVKYGGHAMKSPELMSAVMNDVALLSLVGIKIVLVHGGGPEIDELALKLELGKKKINGFRYTNAEIGDLVQMVLCGKINKNLVAALTRSGVKALGYSGLDAGIIQAKELVETGIDYGGYVGDIVDVNPEPLLDALERGYVPVVSSVALGVDREVSYNINSDVAAARIASAVKAEKLILMTDVKGLLRDPSDESTLIHEASLSEIPGLIKDGIISGGMIPKIDCAVESVRRGVSSATILDGRVPHSILIELLSDEGEGTMIK
ncbi:MAG: acetylglutamate kinase [Oscillospiraceae bacterium]|jgi:acetylglutamate kinase|nr:acetylglutamate kinase [Oscillospiraceae bacterium]